MIISIEDRKKFKKMLVNDEGDQYCFTEIVLIINSDNSCISVNADDEDLFLDGQSFTTNNWGNCIELPEPFTEIWSWEKAVVWCNKQGNVVTKKHLFTAPGFHFIKNINMKELLWNKLNDDGTYKYDEWRKFNDADCLEN